MPLRNYREISDNYKQNLLLGNGFSIGIHAGFTYPSLYKICTDGFDGAPPYFSQEDSGLFESFETTDFEFVLRQLNIARTVDSIYGIPSHRLSERYVSIRNALIQAVRLTHPFAQQLPNGLLPRLNGLLRTFKKVYSLNYDLLCYWAVNYQPDDFRDFYFEGNRFNSVNVDVWDQDATCVYFLHGGLHLYRDGLSTYKARSTGSLLLDFTEQITEEHTPLFVSEGTSSQKMSHIGSNDYLNFCFSSLMNSQNYITIHGASLNAATDGHICAAINLSKVAHIAYGIHQPDNNEEQIIEKKRRVRDMFRDKDVVFYNSDTFFA